MHRKTFAETRSADMLWTADYPAEGARRFPDRLAIINDAKNYSYAELDAASDRFVALLNAWDVGPGARVAYLGKNNAYFFPVFFGCLRAGTILVPINWRYAAGEIAFVLADAEPEVLIFDAEFADGVAAALDIAGVTCRAMTLEGDGPETLAGALEAGVAEPVRERVRHDPNACALMMYTSGTTGRPKGVMLSHRAVSLSRWVEIGSPHWVNWTDDDIILSAMPNFHIGGLSWMLIGLLRSLTCVLTADPSPSNLMDLCRRYAVTRTFMVPTVIRGFVELAESGTGDIGLRSIYYGAAVMDVNLLRRAIDVLGCDFSQYFGMTENCGTITFLPAECHDPARPRLLRSVGKVLPGMELSIRDPSGVECASGVSGEIWVKAPTLMLGYWKRADATGEAMADGWYRSGDGGYLDGEGYLFLTDRLKDMIISGGENVYPAEVEEMLRMHPAVKEVVVVGTPDPTWGEVVTAMIEWKDGRVGTLEEIRVFGRDKIAGYKLPKILRTVSVLPRTATGKLQRGVARKMFGEPLD